MTTRSAFELIPAGAKAVAALLSLAMAALFFWIPGSQEMPWVAILMGLVAATVTAGFILLTGYVYADAGRRGMPQIPWTALVLLIPNGVGFVVYFLLRKPLVHPCLSCGYAVAQGAAFCSVCGCSQASVAVPEASGASRVL